MKIWLGPPCLPLGPPGIKGWLRPCKNLKCKWKLLFKLWHCQWAQRSDCQVIRSRLSINYLFSQLLNGCREGLLGSLSNRTSESAVRIFGHEPTKPLVELCWKVFWILVVRMVFTLQYCTVVNTVHFKVSIRLWILLKSNI